MHASFSFPRVPWQLNIRKEVFSPTEAVRSPLAVHLIFCQVSSFSCPMLVYCRELPSAHVISQPDRVRRPLWRLLPPGPLRARQDEDAARRVRGGAWQRAGREAQVLFARKETQFHTKINFSRVLFQAQHEEEHHRHGKGVPALLRQVRIIYLFILFSPYNIVIFLLCATTLIFEERIEQVCLSYKNRSPLVVMLRKKDCTRTYYSTSDGTPVR